MFKERTKLSFFFSSFENRNKRLFIKVVKKSQEKKSRWKGMASPLSCDMNAILQRILPLFLSVIIMLLTSYNFYSVSFDWIIKWIFINLIPLKKFSTSFREMLPIWLFHVLWSTVKELKECVGRIFYTLCTLGKHVFSFGILSIYSLFLAYLELIVSIKPLGKDCYTSMGAKIGKDHKLQNTGLFLYSRIKGGKSWPQSI